MSMLDTIHIIRPVRSIESLLLFTLLVLFSSSSICLFCYFLFFGIKSTKVKQAMLNRILLLFLFHMAFVYKNLPKQIKYTDLWCFIWYTKQAIFFKNGCFMARQPFAHPVYEAGLCTPTNIKWILSLWTMTHTICWSKVNLRRFFSVFFLIYNVCNMKRLWEIHKFFSLFFRFIGNKYWTSRNMLRQAIQSTQKLKKFNYNQLASSYHSTKSKPDLTKVILIFFLFLLPKNILCKCNLNLYTTNSHQIL